MTIKHSKFSASTILASILMLALSACGDDQTTPVDTEDMAGASQDMGRMLPDLPDPPSQDMGGEQEEMGPVEDMTSRPEDMGIDEDMMADMPPEVDMGPFEGCRAPRAEDGNRFVVVSNPYDKDTNASTLYRVFELDTEGNLTDRFKPFDMGVATGGEIQFTPDGKIGISAQKDGSVGIFELDAQGNPRVIKATWKGMPTQEEPGGSLYASSVVMAPEGDAYYLINSAWRTSGGGIWRVPLDCQTGEPGQEEFFLPTKLPRYMAWMPNVPDMLVLAAHDVLDTEERHDLHTISLSDGEMPSRIASSRAFMDDDASISAFGISRDGQHALLGDFNLFGSPMNNNRLAAFALEQDGSMQPVQTILDVKDPASIEFSPHNNAALVTSAEGNRILLFSYDPGAAMPFANLGPIMTSTTTPLPVEMVQVERGMQDGTVLVTELSSIRVVAFQPDGTVTELSNMPLGEGVQHIVGAIGVQP